MFLGWRYRESRGILVLLVELDLLVILVATSYM